MTTELTYAKRYKLIRLVQNTLSVKKPPWVELLGIFPGVGRHQDRVNVGKDGCACRNRVAFDHSVFAALVRQTEFQESEESVKKFAFN